jgi:hypothetical protein
VTHYIIPAGPYAKAYGKLEATGFQLHLAISTAERPGEGQEGQQDKYTCPECEQNAWAKPDALLICGVCYEDGEGDIVLMLAESGETLWRKG